GGSRGDIRDIRAWQEEVGGDAPEAWLTERWRAVRYATETRGLRWRLQRERHRADCLAHEMSLRSRYTEEVERRLEASQAQVALLTQSAAAADKSTSSSTAASHQRSSNLRAGSPVSKARPRPRTASDGTTSLPVDLDLGRSGKAPPPPVESTSPKAWPMPVLRGGVAAAVAELEAHGAPGVPSGASAEQLRASREAQTALRGELLELRQEVAKRVRQVAGLSAELAARDVRLSKLNHEVRAKDSLLGCLSMDPWRPAEESEEELARLLQSAAAPLAALFGHGRGGGAAGTVGGARHATLAASPSSKILLRQSQSSKSLQLPRRQSLI
ncbi:unnamed protein product, partial [Polarella glacialis]